MEAGGRRRRGEEGSRVEEAMDEVGEGDGE